MGKVRRLALTCLCVHGVQSFWLMGLHSRPDVGMQAGRVLRHTTDWTQARMHLLDTVPIWHLNSRSDSTFVVQVQEPVAVDFRLKQPAVAATGSPPSTQPQVGPSAD